MTGKGRRRGRHRRRWWSRRRLLVAASVVLALPLLVYGGVALYAQLELASLLRGIEARGEPAGPDAVGLAPRDSGPSWGSLRTVVDALGTVAAEADRAALRTAWNELAGPEEPGAARPRALAVFERRFAAEDAAVGGDLPGRLGLCEPRPGLGANAAGFDQDERAAAKALLGRPPGEPSLALVTAALGRRALAAAASGDAEAALADLQALHCWARLLRTAPALEGFRAWSDAEVGLLRAVEAVARLLPGPGPAAMLQELVDDPAEPRAALAQALLDQRAVDRARWQGGGDYPEDFEEALEGILLWPALDECFHLERMGRLAALAREPFHRVPPDAIDPGLLVRETPATAPRSHLLVPPARGLFVLAASLEARLAMGRAALAAAGLRAAPAPGEDPFTGRPLGVRQEQDGSWTLWSAGPDGVDDSGTVSGRRQGDLVWKARVVSTDGNR